MKFESCLRLADTLNSGCLITTHNRVSTPHHLLYVSTKRNIPEFLENTLVTKIICGVSMVDRKNIRFEKGLGNSSIFFILDAYTTEIERYIKFTRRVLIVIIYKVPYILFLLHDFHQQTIFHTI